MADEVEIKMADENSYNFNYPKRGLAVIICNKSFDHGTNLNYRNGAGLDVKHMKKMFKRLGFTIKEYTNKGKKEMEEILDKTAKKEILADSDCFACVISSHGNDISEKIKSGTVQVSHAIYGTDGNLLRTKDIVERFDDANCRQLRNKPKLFFIQACRIQKGNRRTTGYDNGAYVNVITPAENSGDGDNRHNLETDGADGSDADGIDADVSHDLSQIDDSDDEEGSEADTSDTDADNSSDDEDKGEITDLTSQNLVKRCKLNTDHQKTSENSMEYGGREKEQIPRNQSQQDSSSAAGKQDEMSKTSARVSHSSSGLQYADMSFNAKIRDLDEIDPPTVVRLYPAVATKEIITVPCYNDMLVMFASPQGYYSIRNRKVGSYLLKLLFEVTKIYYGKGRQPPETDFLSVLNRVAFKMAKMEFTKSKTKCVPCLIHRLTGDIYFNPKPALKTKWFCF